MERNYKLEKRITSDYFDVLYFDSLPSTNEYAKELSKNTNKNTLIIANTQTEGVGRLNRKFFSPTGGLYLSYLFFDKLPTEYANYLTPCVAVLVKKALQKFVDIDVKTKWVNDLYLNDKKLCGILCNSTIINGKIANFVVGIGLNVNTTEFGEYSEIATSLKKETKKDYDLERLINEISLELAKLPSEIENKGFIKEYISSSYLTGKEVLWEDKLVKVLGVNEDCTLKILCENKEYDLVAGEVSLKLK